MWYPVQNPLANVYLSAIVAFIPLLWLLVGLGWFKIKAYWAAVISVLLAFVISSTVWEMPLNFAFQAILEGILTGLWPIAWVIIAAIYTYNVTVETGNMRVINDTLAKISPDRRVQALLIAFSFGGFLEAAAGFGTAVAIPASLLAGIGFDPLFASVICLIANTVPVAFGGIGIPVITLAQVTGLSEEILSAYTAYQLVPFIVVLPFVLVVVMTKSLKGLKDVFDICLVSGISFAAFQTLGAVYIGPEMAAIIGSLSSLLAVAIYARLKPIKDIWVFPGEKAKYEIASTKSMVQKEENMSAKKQFVAWTPYIVLLVLIMSVNLLPQFKFLGDIFTKVQVYFGPEAKPLVFQWINTPGTIMFISAIVGGLVQKSSIKNLAVVLMKTVKQLAPTIAVVSSIVAMAKIMDYSGMVSVLAIALANAAGKVYPFISPLIGALGTFITGSDTSSNILFGALQKQTALQINANPAWIASANTVGATAGKMISPQSIAVAASATGLLGKEGEILKSTIPYCLIYALLLGVLVLAMESII